MFHKDHWKIVKCTSCNFIFLKNAPDYTTLANSFEWDDSYTTERKERRKRNRVYYFFSDLLKKPKAILRHKRKEIAIIEKVGRGGNFLDVGCGVGATLASIPDNYVPYGIEISKHLSEIAGKYCSSKGGYVINADAESGLRSFGKNYFDLILMRSYLEHEIEPLKVLEAAHDVMKENSLLLIKVPNFSCLNRKLRGVSWPGFRFPDHVNYFTPATLSSMILKSGMKIERFRMMDHSLLNDNMWLIAKKAK